VQSVFFNQITDLSLQFITYNEVTCKHQRWKTVLKRKSQPHKLHIWFFPTLEAKTQKTKRAISCQRSAEISEENVTLQIE
jgi:hypothetical protein